MKVLRCAVGCSSKAVGPDVALQRMALLPAFPSSFFLFLLFPGGAKGLSLVPPHILNSLVLVAPSHTTWIVRTLHFYIRNFSLDIPLSLQSGEGRDLR